jgi:hypothetical protein
MEKSNDKNARPRWRKMIPICWHPKKCAC